MKNQFSSHVPIEGSQKVAPLKKKIGEINKDELISVTVKVKPKADIPDLLNTSVNEPFKPMTRESFQQEFGASPAAVKKVEDFADHFGLSIIETNIGEGAIQLRGTVLQMEEAFKVHLGLYEHEEGQYFRGRSGQINIPEELDGIVEGVFGLDNREAAKNKIRILEDSQHPFTQQQIPGEAFYPNELSRIYHYPKDATGAGQCIAIIELGGGYRKKDITKYFEKLNIKSPKVVAVSVDGGHNKPGKPDSADGEVMLDIEVAAGIAPDATIVVYFAPNTDKGFLDAIGKAVHDTRYKPSVISISWGSAEARWTKQSLKAYNTTFKAAALMGVTVCAAAGDSGSDDNMGDGLAHVDFPASSPYVLSCGGTKLTVDSNDKILSEVVWNESNNSATGGGVSEIFSKPSYQKNAAVPPSVNTGFSGRGVPDLAAVADPYTGYHVLVDGQAMVVGGTSAVAPLMAGLISLINEKLHKNVGFIHPKLYANPDVCNDIIKGDNITVSGNKGYKAQKGWDACTGNGSADGIKLMDVLQ